MCGIAGYIDWSPTPIDRDILWAMTRTLTPRGPDAQQIWTAPHVGLGHTRLAITDPAGGHQPMVAHRDHAGPLALTYSGEIYNHQDLRVELAAAGHSFRTRSDTEVVLRAYQQWGPNAVERFNGMFAFALWDAREQTLVLARDRLGIKPLYFSSIARGIAFGSELKALLAHPDITAELDDDGLAELVAMVPMTSPGSGVLSGIHEVEPGTVKCITYGGVTTRRYWSLQSTPHHDDLDTTVATIRRLLEASVARQSVADVPVCALNSGGVDSAAVAALAAVQLTGQEHFHTFDLDHDTGEEVAHAASSFHRERDHPYALLAAEHIGSRHHTLTVTSDDVLAAHDSALRAMDLPSLSTINVSLALLFRRVAAHAPCALSGEGADELFHGYRWYHDDEADAFPWHATYRPVTALLNESTLRQIRPGQYARERYQQAVEATPRLPDEDARARRMRQIAWLTNSFYLPFLLRRKDRLSMSAGVEVRVPFLDHELVEYAWNIPAAMHTADGREKSVLRRAVADLLPPTIAWRPKSGYPATLMSTYHEALWSRARDLLSRPASSVWTLFDRRNVAALLQRHHGDLSDWTPTQHIAYLLELDTWLDLYRVRIK